MYPQFNKIKETSLYIKDVERSRQFYHVLLGLPIISEVNGSHIFFRAGTSVLLCFIELSTKDQTNLPSHYAKGEYHYAFESDKEDYDTWKRHILESGIEIEHEQEWGKLKSFYFRDPDRHCVEVIMTGMWEDKK